MVVGVLGLAPPPASSVITGSGGLCVRPIHHTVEEVHRLTRRLEILRCADGPVRSCALAKRLPICRRAVCGVALALAPP
jgi:hypothetical protein